MIAALLLAISANSVLETVSPNVSRIRIVGILSLPPLGPHATRITRSIVASMNGNTEDFTRRQVLDIVVSGPRFEWTPDHIRIEFGVSPRGLKTGLRLMESLIRRPSTDPFIPAADPSPWDQVPR
jgi:hypothetical protein